MNQPRLPSLGQIKLSSAIQRYEKAQIARLLSLKRGGLLLHIDSPSGNYRDVDFMTVRKIYFIDQPQILCIEKVPINTVVGCCCQLPFIAESFDVIWLSHATEWVDDIQNLIHDCSHLLKANGMMIIHSLNPKYIWRWLTPWRSEKIFPNYQNLWKSFSLKQMIRSAGLEIELNKTFAFKSSMVEDDQTTPNYLEKLLEMIFPNCGGINSIVAIKPVHGMTSQPSTWWKKEFSPNASASGSPVRNWSYDKEN